MTLPKNLYEKYLNRFNDLILEGEELEKIMHPTGIEMYNPAFQDLFEWKIKCITLLNQVVPENHPYFGRWLNDLALTSKSDDGKGINTIALNRGLGYLRAIESDLEAGILDDLALQIEAEIAADYLGQAEYLLNEGQPGQYDHIPAAVLTGAVLEKELRSLCDRQMPPIQTEENGKPFMLNRLVDELKKAKVINELKAKQLKAWADIRNKAAHGQFEQFTRYDVELMINGVRNFLANL
ncbi:DUF4145 domain-containing protein [Cyanobacteria bacterium FACHB-63]|nr:DUF4145 domain-containing protein [Cyanobacteria bacterium FACHB-63]